MLTETVFAWPGLGQYITSSLLSADMNAVLGGHDRRGDDLHRPEPPLRPPVPPGGSPRPMTPRRPASRRRPDGGPGSSRRRRRPAAQARLGQAYVGWLGFRRNPLAMAGLAVLVGLVLIALSTPLLTDRSPVAQDLGQRLQPPSAQYWFGTDELGRDIYTRVLYGSRITLVIVGLVVVMVAPTGLLIGTAAGYLGGWVDTVLMRVTDVFLAFPRLILALAFVSALGPGIENAVIAIAFTAWPPYARVARAETLTIREQRLHRGDPPPGRRAAPHRAGPRRPALHLVADRPRRPRHGRDHPDRRRARLPRPRRPAARARVGRHDRVGAAVPPRPVVGGDGARDRDPRREPRVQPARGRAPGRPRSRRSDEPA